MRNALLALGLLLVLSGCAGTRFEIDRDPATGELTHIELHRDWLAGPVECTITKNSDGSMTFHWASVVDLEPAVQRDQQYLELGGKIAATAIKGTGAP